VPRVKDQDIPPDMASLYADALGPTKDLKYPGAGHPGLDDVVTKHYPAILEPPHEPSDEQLEEREEFLKSVACFNAAPANERFAYYRLSLNSGLFYYDYYHKLNIPRFIAGESCDQIKRPLATAFLGQAPLCPATISTRWFQLGSITFHLDATLDPAIYFACTADPWGQALILVQFYLDTDEEPPLWKYNWTHPFNPAVRTRYSQDFTLPDPGYEQRQLNLNRFSLTDSQAVTWIFRAEVEEQFYAYDNWSEIPE
jgi:hypothetical protein